ncbi:hypothetical protein AC249_AIPGENE17981 [Exaiptasia diaphana]|nr:hypothetical protein AC249_AIPGENE17981 [Exaiptasia diaphana]
MMLFDWNSKKCSYQTQPIIGAASHTEKVPEGGRSPTDDKRYTIEQLNRAARHRNVYMDRAGGDPYGVSSPMVARGKRSVGTQQLYPVGSDFHAKPKPMYARKQMNIEEKRNYIGQEMYLSLVCVFGLLAVTSGSYQTQPIIGAASYTEKVPEGGRSPTDDKRYTIEQLNRAARHRNVYMDRAGGDPYGVSSPMVARGKRSVGTQQLYPVGSDFHAKPKPMYARKQMNIEEKRNYIGASPIVSRSFIRITHRHGRSANDDKKSKTIYDKLKIQKNCCCVNGKC